MKTSVVIKFISDPLSKAPTIFFSKKANLNETRGFLFKLIFIAFWWIGNMVNYLNIILYYSYFTICNNSIATLKFDENLSHYRF